MKAILIVLTIILLSASACVEVDTGLEPRIRYGETVRVINNLRYTAFITYRTESRSKEIILSPGQEGVISGLPPGEYLVAQIYSSVGFGEIVGTTDYRIRKMRDGAPQLWRITSYRRIR